MKKRTQKRTKRNESIVQLRSVLEMTQAEFAQLVGVSVISIKKIECGTLALSDNLARRIFLQTGVDAASLKSGDGKIYRAASNHPYDREQFDDWRKRIFPSNTGAALKSYDEIIVPHMMLLCLAAGLPAKGKVKDRLRGFLDCWAKWEAEAVEHFGLGPQINDLLKRAERRIELTKTWGEWRQLYKQGEQFREQMRKQNPDAAKRYGSLPQEYGFKDDRRKKDDEKLTLSTRIRFGFSAGLRGFPDGFANELRALTLQEK